MTFDVQTLLLLVYLGGYLHLYWPLLNCGESNKMCIFQLYLQTNWHIHIYISTLIPAVIYQTQF